MVDKLENVEKQEIARQLQEQRKQKKEEKETAKFLKKTETKKTVTTPRNQPTRSVISDRTRNLMRTQPKVSGNRKTIFTFTSPRTTPKIVAKIKEDILPQLLIEKNNKNLNLPHFLEVKLATRKTEPPIGDQGEKMCDQPETGMRETRKHE